MSQLIAPTHTVVDHIPLGRRISEIMQEKGPAYTISAMAKRLDISRETLRLMLKGEREIYNYELEKIATDLKVPVERILQRDVEQEQKRFDQIRSTFVNVESAAILTDIFLEVSIGITETFFAIKKKGIYWYLTLNYDSAHERWLEALSIAWKIQEKYGDAKPLINITSNLSITFIVKKEYQSFKKLVEQVEKYFDESPEFSGVITQGVGRVYEGQGDLDKASEKWYQALHYTEKTGNITQIMKLKLNLAFNEYLMKNYGDAVDLYESAWEFLMSTTDQYFRFLSLTNFSKCLIRVDQIKRAKEVLLAAKKSMDAITSITESYLEIEGQWFMLFAIVENNPFYAEKMIHREEISINTRKIACKFLADYYDKIGNVELKEQFQSINHIRCTAIDMLLHEKEHDVQYLITLLDISHLVGWNKT